MFRKNLSDIRERDNNDNIIFVDDYSLGCKKNPTMIYLASVYLEKLIYIRFEYTLHRCINKYLSV